MRGDSTKKSAALCAARIAVRQRWRTAGVARLAALALMASCVAPVSLAAYPERPIRMVIGYAPGGGTDTIARILAEGLSATVGQSVVVENVPGGSAAIATQRVIASPPDGYTLQLANSTEIVINPLITPDLPYNAEKGLAPVAYVGSLPSVLVGRKGLAPDTLPELIAYLRNAKTPASAAVPGVGTPPHLALELFKAKAGVRLLPVQYKGAAPALADILGGHVDIGMMTLPAVLPYLKADKLKIYGVTTNGRTPAAPEIPPISEQQGFAGFDVVSWFAVYAPANTPEMIVVGLQTAVLETLKDPKVRAKLEAQAVTVTPADRQALAARARSEHKDLQPIIRAADIKPAN